jgi:23S rRNA (adenine2503-C2)-methyltransferase
MEIIYTHTGKIYVDRERQLEFLTVGDYGKENNIKADFLGLHKEINGVAHREVDLSEKWVATISTQKGCPMRCQFCDCPKFGFHGNVSRDEMDFMIRTILENETVKATKRFNVHYARMGEPTFNRDVLDFAMDLRQLVRQYIYAETVHPVVSTMMPRSNKYLEDFLSDWCFIKNDIYGGEAGLQLSINSTDEAQREAQFGGMSLSLREISRIAEWLSVPRGRKYTLNFAVTENTVLDAKELSRLFDKDQFIVKITPIHKTSAAVKNGFNVTTEYTDYNVYRKFEAPLLAEGWDVIVFVPSAEEDADRITCGNALIATKEE